VRVLGASEEQLASDAPLCSCAGPVARFLVSFSPSPCLLGLDSAEVLCFSVAGSPLDDAALPGGSAPSLRLVFLGAARCLCFLFWTLTGKTLCFL
jgi:hypothetical protein